MSEQPRAFVFAGGGTGGHIFPALAIHEELAALGPTRSVFLCSDRPLDAKILGKEHAHFRSIRAKPFGLKPRALFRFLQSWGPSVRAASMVIRDRLRAGEDVHVVAMGGFVAPPVVKAAAALGVPVTLVNMDAVPGKANRWVAKRAQRVVTSAPVPGARWVQVPPIVRSAAVASIDAPSCRTALGGGLDANRQTLLVTGASQGARSINAMMMHLARERPKIFEGWQVIHQTGAGEDANVTEAYAAAGIPALVRPFFDRMAEAWGAADLAVSRAGAGSVAEAWANAVPTLFMPYPFHKDQHQRYNAQPLERAGAAIIAGDAVDPAANAQGAGQTLAELLTEDDRRAALRAGLKDLGPADGARRIAEMLMGGTPLRGVP